MTPDGERHDRLTGLLAQALELPAVDRAALLARLAGEDRALHDELCSLLATSTRGGDYLQEFSSSLLSPLSRAATDRERQAEAKEILDHLRASLVALSAEGRRILAALDARQQAWLARCLHGLSRGELERLARSLDALAGRVEAATGHERTGTSQRAKRRGADGARRRPAALRSSDPPRTQPRGEPA